MTMARAHVLVVDDDIEIRSMLRRVLLAERYDVDTARNAEEGVRRARMSKSGEWIVYECGPDLWVVGTGEGSKPRKLAIEVHADDKDNGEQVLTLTQGV